jgi:hypothetical protein
MKIKKIKISFIHIYKLNYNFHHLIKFPIFSTILIIALPSHFPYPPNLDQSYYFSFPGMVIQTSKQPEFPGADFPSTSIYG